jgi:RNA polymerase sigma-70 factor (ECF subfamily)
MHVTMDDPEQILLHGRCDDGQLARALLKQYYAPLHYLAHSLLTDAAAADDIVQETLLIALDKIDQYEPGTDLKAWLCRIAIYRCRDVMRRRKIRRKWYEVWSRLSVTTSPHRGPEKTAGDRELVGELWLAVNELHDKHRLPIILHFLHGLTAVEIAGILEIKEGTVYSRLHYACRTLAGRFSDSELESWAKELLNE